MKVTQAHLPLPSFDLCCPWCQASFSFSFCWLSPTYRVSDYYPPYVPTGVLNCMHNWFDCIFFWSTRSFWTYSVISFLDAQHPAQSLTYHMPNRYLLKNSNYNMIRKYSISPMEIISLSDVNIMQLNLAYYLKRLTFHWIISPLNSERPNFARFHSSSS